MKILSKINYKFYQRIILSIFFIIFYSQAGNSTENKIEYKVDNEIITSIDINNEKTFIVIKSKFS